MENLKYSMKTLKILNYNKVKSEYILKTTELYLIYLYPAENMYH